MPQEPITLEQARSAAESLLSRRLDRIEPFQPPVGGADSHAFRLWAGIDAMLLQIKRRPGTPIGVYFHGRIKEAGLPVPELIGFEPAGGPAGQACALWEWVDGEPAEWAEDELCPYDEAEFGQLLRRIHDLQFDGQFGFLGDDLSQRTYSCTPDLPAVSTSWPGFFRCDLAARRYFDKGYIDRGEADILSSLPDRLGDELGRAEPRLLHMGDIMHNGHIIVDTRTGGILAVIDYTESMAADPRWELAWVDYYFGQFPFNTAAFDMDRFRAGYGTDHDPADPLGRFYLAAILLFEKLLFFKPGEPRTAWAVQKLKHILAEFDRTGKRASDDQQRRRQRVMKYDKFSKDTTRYELDGRYALVSAPEREFGISYAVYRNANPEVFQTFLEYGSDLEGLHYCYWVLKSDRRVGGIIIRPNHIEGLFVVPPFADAYGILAAVKPILLSWSGPGKDVEAVEVLPDELEHYHRLGFRDDCIRRHLIRPTECFDIAWEDDFELLPCRADSIAELAGLFVESFAGGVAKYGRYGLEDYLARLKRYFERRKQGDSFDRASTLIRDRHQDRFAGACLVGMADGVPAVGYLAVHPQYRRRGLATRMLKKALTALKAEWPLLKIRVFVGNPAESVYYNLGFQPGPERHSLRIPAGWVRQVRRAPLNGKLQP